jgi:hypothetical protein
MGPERWEHLTAGVSNIATAAALVAGGAWAVRKFQRTPESRVKITLTVDAEWPDHDSPVVRVNVSARNDGGHKWSLWWSDRSSSRPDGLASPVLIDDAGGSTAQGDMSRVALWALVESDLEGEALHGGYAAWARIEPTRAEAGCEDILLRPTDVWSNDLLFRVPAEAVAVRAAAWIWVKTRDNIYPIEANRVSTRPARERS